MAWPFDFRRYFNTRGGGGSSGGRPASLRDVPGGTRLADAILDRQAMVEAQMRRLREITRVEQMNANYRRDKFLESHGLDPNYRPLKRD